MKKTSNRKGKMLITVSENDIVLRFFEGLKELYPMGEYHVFPEGMGGHSIGLISPRIFNQRIRTFLEG